MQLRPHAGKAFEATCGMICAAVRWARVRVVSARRALTRLNVRVPMLLVVRYGMKSLSLSGSEKEESEQCEQLRRPRVQSTFAAAQERCGRAGGARGLADSLEAEANESVYFDFPPFTALHPQCPNALGEIV